MTRPRFTTSAGLVLALILGAGTAACSGSQGGAGGGQITLTVNGRPPEAQQEERRIFDQDVKAFERAHPDIDIEAEEGFMEPEKFAAKLAGGQLEDVFYVYFTDPAQLIARGQAADITEHVEDFPNLDTIRPELLDVFRDGEGHLYGLPTANYSMGLLYNRDLFEQAGLDPDSPPTTWDAVADAADKIAELDGKTGFAELSKNNQGGWHFTAWMYSLGGEVVRSQGGSHTAAFDNGIGREVLRRLHEMRWKDRSMGEEQLLEDVDVQRMMGAGNLGMYIAAPDNILTLVNQFEGDYADYGLGPIPGRDATLIGGEGYMFNPNATPETIEAGLTWLQWKFLNPDRMEESIKDRLEQDAPVGLPMPPTPDIWTGAVRERQEVLKAQYANVPLENYQPFMDASQQIEGKIEPVQAQEVYAVLDGMMQAVLTDESADVDALLDDAATKVDDILARAN